MHRLALLIVLGCGEPKHELPVVKLGSDEAPPSRRAQLDEIEKKMMKSFEPPPRPSTADQIAKLEAQRAKAPEAERKFIDRSIGLIKAGEAAYAEQDKVKARAMQLQLMRDTVAFNDDMAAFAPDDLDAMATVASTYDMTAANIESAGFADELPPRPLREKARVLAEKLTKKHATSARAWALLGRFTTDRTGKLRAWHRCTKIDGSCKAQLDEARADYVRPYCEGADLASVDLDYRAASRKPIAGGTRVEEHYEQIWLAPKPTLTFADVIRVEAGETHITHHMDGKTEEEVKPSVTFVFAPGKYEALVKWTRELEARDDMLAVMRDGKLLFTSPRAMWDDSQTGIAGVKIDEFCKSTKTRTLPPLD